MPRSINKLWTSHAKIGVTKGQMAGITVNTLVFGTRLRAPLLPVSQRSGYSWRAVHGRLADARPRGHGRRRTMLSVSFIFEALTSFTGKRKLAQEAVRRGMQSFVQGKVEQSVVEFDKAIELDPAQRKYLWQRGLSLYYLNRFAEGAIQFRDDVAENPNDTEEAIWCFLCEAQIYGVDETRKRFLEVGRDSRPIMRNVYETFKNGADPNQLMKQFSNGSDRDYFYAALYAGLYHESQNDLAAAEAAIISACNSPYGQGSGDYMAALAKVHCKCRGWSVDGFQSA